MRSLFQITIFDCLLLILLCDTPSFAQVNLLDLVPDRKKEWRRISTDADTAIYVKTSSLVLESNGQIRATFRFNLTKQEIAIEKPGAKYKTRLQTIQFDTREYTYRIVETTLLDSDEKVIYASSLNSNGEWRRIRGVTAGRFYNIATQLPPLGAWTIVATRYPAGEKPGPDENDSNSTPVVRSPVNAQINRFQVGKRSCTKPTYESATLRSEDFLKWTGFSLKDAGFAAEKVDAIKIKCDTSSLVSEVHVLLLASANRATLLSGGVLLDLQKQEY